MSPFTCIIGSLAILFLAILLHNVCFILHLSLKEYWQNRKDQVSEVRIHLCASERSERAIFWGFNSFTVKKINFFTINIKFEVILSLKSGGDICTGHPPPKKWGDVSPHPPPPPGIYASGHWWFLREPRIIPPWDLHVPFTCIIGI